MSQNGISEFYFPYNLFSQTKKIRNITDARWEQIHLERSQKWEKLFLKHLLLFYQRDWWIFYCWIGSLNNTSLSSIRWLHFCWDANLFGCREYKMWWTKEPATADEFLNQLASQKFLASANSGHQLIWDPGLVDSPVIEWAQFIEINFMAFLFGCSGQFLWLEGFDI